MLRSRAKTAQRDAANVVTTVACKCEPQKARNSRILGHQKTWQCFSFFGKCVHLQSNFGVKTSNYQEACMCGKYLNDSDYKPIVHESSFLIVPQPKDKTDKPKANVRKCPLANFTFCVLLPSFIFIFFETSDWFIWYYRVPFLQNLTRGTHRYGLC